MSSNELHITRANYEAYFLLYVDGELTSAQNDAVEAFAALHPDLQEELDLLLTTRLDAETISFDKTALMADSMKQNAFDESLLLYIDDELEGEEKKKVEQQLANNATYQYQHKLLVQTKLPAEEIAYPDKAELYRKTERRIRPLVWTRSAAAAVMVLMASSYLWYQNQHLITDGNTTTIIVNTPSTTTPSTSNDDVAVTPATAEQEPAETDTDYTESQTQEAVAVNRPTNTAVQYTAHSTATSTATDEVRTDVAVTRSTTIADPVAAQQTTVSQTVVVTPQQDINKLPVTSSTSTALNNQKEYITEVSGDQNVALESENQKRGSVKGFLRKATRFIERRTGVATTNEDDELLIGAVAIKLK